MIGSCPFAQSLGRLIRRRQLLVLARFICPSWPGGWEVTLRRFKLLRHKPRKRCRKEAHSAIS